MVTHENCEGSISSNPEKKEFTQTIKNARKKLEIHLWLLLCPAKFWRRIVGMVRPIKMKKTRLACILEADESKRLREGESLRNHHEDHSTRKGNNSLQSYNLVHKFVPMSQALQKFQQQKQRWTRNGKIGEIFGVEPDESQKQERGKRRFRFLRSIHWTRIISISNDSRQDHGYHLQIARMQWTSSRRSISVHPSENGRCSKIIEKFQKCSDIWIRLPRHKCPKSWYSMEDAVVPLERNLYGHPLARLFIWERLFEKILLKHGWEKIPNWECLFVHREEGLFLSVYVDDIKLAGKKQNMGPTWRILMNDGDLGEPTSFLDHGYLGCTQRECQISKDIVDNYRSMFESRISVRTEKLPYSENLRISSWSYDMEGHAKKCVERYCELANKTTEQLYKVATPCTDDHQCKEEDGSAGELSTGCSQNVLKCLYLAVLVGLILDGLWTNLFVRKRNGHACDKLLSRLISYIHHTCENRQYCHVGNTAHNIAD